MIVEVVNRAVLEGNRSTACATEESRRARAVVFGEVAPPESDDLIIAGRLERRLEDAPVLPAVRIRRRLIAGQVFSVRTRVRGEATNRALVLPLAAGKKKPPLILFDWTADIHMGVVIVLKILSAVEALTAKWVVDVAGLNGVSHHVDAAARVESVSTGAEHVIDRRPGKLHIGGRPVCLDVHLFGVRQIRRLIVAVHLEVFDHRRDTRLTVRGEMLRAATISSSVRPPK